MEPRQSPNVSIEPELCFNVLVFLVSLWEDGGVVDMERGLKGLSWVGVRVGMKY